MNQKNLSSEAHKETKVLFFQNSNFQRRSCRLRRSLVFTVCFEKIHLFTHDDNKHKTKNFFSQNKLIFFVTLWTMLCHFFWILNDNKSIIWNPHRGTNDCLFSIRVETLWWRENSFSFAVGDCFDSTYCTPFLIIALFKTLNALRKRIKDIFTYKDKGISADHAITTFNTGLPSSVEDTHIIWSDV